MDQMALQVVEGNVAVQHEVRDRSGHWYALRMRPYQTVENRVEGILAVLVDIHDFKKYSAAIVDTIQGCLIVLDSHFQVLLASPAFYRTFEVNKQDTEGRLFWELGNGQWNILQLREMLEKVLPEKREVANFEVQHEFPAIGRKVIVLHARELQQGELGSPKILMVIEDITDRRITEERIHQLLARVVNAGEAEGKRIARELHDSFGPQLGRVNLQVAELERRLASQPDLVSALETVRKGVGEIAKATHDLSRQLHPAALLQLGLAVGLEGECVVFSKLCGIRVNFSAEGMPESLPDEVGLGLYRIVQEALRNIYKHAQVKTAAVRLLGNDREVTLTIEDFGKGFELSAGRTGHGLGLVSMKERAEMVNGTLSVTSKPGKGTMIEVRVPLPGA